MSPFMPFTKLPLFYTCYLGVLSGSDTTTALRKFTQTYCKGSNVKLEKTGKEVPDGPCAIEIFPSDTSFALDFGRSCPMKFLPSPGIFVAAIRETTLTFRVESSINSSSSSVPLLKLVEFSIALKNNEIKSISLKISALIFRINRAKLSSHSLFMSFIFSISMKIKSCYALEVFSYDEARPDGRGSCILANSPPLFPYYGAIK